MKNFGSDKTIKLNLDQIEYILKDTSQDHKASKQKGLFLTEIKSAIAKGRDPRTLPVPDNEKSEDGGNRLSSDIACGGLPRETSSELRRLISPDPISRANSEFVPIENPISRANSVFDPLDPDIVSLTAPQLKYIFHNTSQDHKASKQKGLFLTEIKSAIAEGRDPKSIPVPGNEKSGDSPNTGVGVNEGAGARLRGSSSQRELP